MVSSHQPKVLVLGIRGMLGNQVFDYFVKHTGFQVFGTSKSINDLSGQIFSYRVLSVCRYNFPGNLGCIVC